jgi:uncharacterized protein (TIGR02145 family)
MKKFFCCAATVIAMTAIGCGDDNGSNSPSNASTVGESSSSTTLNSSATQKQSSSATVSSSSAKKEIVFGTMIDSRNDQTYKTVVIGEGESAQTWMAENLNYDYANSFCYSNNDYYCQKYGRLYPWEVAQKVCPEGWHLPSKEDFEQLSANMGNFFTPGTRIRSTTEWPDIDGTDNFGFGALPAGYRDDSFKFHNLGETAHFWTSSENDNGQGICLSLTDHFDSEGTASNDKHFAFSVRCLKN